MFHAGWPAYGGDTKTTALVLRETGCWRGANCVSLLHKFVGVPKKLFEKTATLQPGGWRGQSVVA